LRGGWGLGFFADTGGADDAADAFDFHQEPAELAQAGCLQRNGYRDAGITVIGQVDGDDINFFLSNQSGDITHQPHSIVSLNLNLDGI